MLRTFLLFFFFFFVETAVAKSMIDCRVATSRITQCNPYGARLYKTKKIVYKNDKKKLIIVKTLSTPKKRFVKVISVEDMLEKYLQIKNPLRFKNDLNSPVAVVVEDQSGSQTMQGQGRRPTQKKKVAYRQYIVVKGDALSHIAQKFGLKTKVISKINKLTSQDKLQIGQVLKLPSSSFALDINAFGTKRLRVTATAYTSHSKQTDSTPFLAAWNNHIRPGMKIVAVSRDLLTRFGMQNGTKIRIDGLKGYYRVRDKMNKRYKKRIDIYMGLDRKKALRWGRRSVMIYW